MMLGVSILDTAMKTLGFLASGDFSVVQVFLQANLCIFGYMHCHCRSHLQHTGNILYPLHTPRVWSSCLDNSHAMDGNGSNVHFCISGRYTISAIAVLGAVLASIMCIVSRAAVEGK